MKSRIFTTLGTGLALAVLATVSTPSAKADIITSLASQTSSGGMNDYTFSVLLTGDEEVSNTLSYAQFGTLYDLSSASVTPISMTGLLATDFTFSSAATNTAAYLTNAPDSASSWNLRYTYNGTSTVAGPTQLGTFTIGVSSPLSTIYFDGQAGKSTGTPGNETGNIGSINVPAQSGVPEPASMMLLGAGLFGLGFIGRRKAGKKSVS